LLSRGFMINKYGSHGEEVHELVPVKSADDVGKLKELEFVDIERHYKPGDEILYGPEFAAEVGRLFEALYPLYLFFVSEDVGTDATGLVEDGGGEVDDDEKYTFEQLQSETFLVPEFLKRLEDLLLDKGQIVLYGPPGTGKTFVAKRLARYFVDQMGGEVQVVQFHPSYSYEEFVEGIRPRSEDGELRYPVEAGIFQRLCDEARRHPDSRYVLVVDEINRGSLPRIFGELLYLLEYRGEAERVVLPYSKKRFYIPHNVFLIGTMNTADRSIALVDHALRRRFHFVQLRPDPEVLQAWLEKKGREAMAWVVDLLKEVNRRLTEDKVDWHLHIGHSHWMVREGPLDEERAALIWEHSVQPTLEEYFYNRADRLSRYDYETLRSAVTSVE
jgi:5-methylcytosine-specific restriction protein B